MLIVLSALFFMTALLYSSVGFGGGSTYLALLSIWSLPYTDIPLLALSCNIIVVSGNCFHYIRAGNLKSRLLFPYILSSVPLAYLGGSLAISKTIFQFGLFLSLMTSGLLLFFRTMRPTKAEEQIKDTPLSLSLLIGALLGFVSGVIGIGGGIFLSPILFLLRAGNPKQIATTASLFIFINSISGISGQLSKSVSVSEYTDYWPLWLAVCIGGQLGNFLHLKLLSPKRLSLITAGLVLLVSIRMGLRLL